VMGNYRKLIHHCAHVALPFYHRCRLGEMVKMGGQRKEPQLRDIGTVHFTWSRDAQEAFQMSQDAISKAPVLVLSKEGGKYLLLSNRSKYEVRTVISHK